MKTLFKKTLAVEFTEIAPSISKDLRFIHEGIVDTYISEARHVLSLHPNFQGTPPEVDDLHPPRPDTLLG
jgi:hypothetical protein